MDSREILLDPTTTALILIDLQNGMVHLPHAPRTGYQVVGVARRLADHFRKLNAPVVLVNVSYPLNRRPVADMPMPPLPDTMPSGWDSIVVELGQQDSDIQITKHGWGAFTSTQLDNELGMRGISSIVLAGIATNFGVEQTAREALQLGYEVVCVSDAMASLSKAHHDFAIEHIFPLVGRVRTSERNPRPAGSIASGLPQSVAALHRCSGRAARRQATDRGVGDLAANLGPPRWTDRAAAGARLQGPVCE